MRLGTFHSIGAQKSNKYADGKNIGHGPFTDGAYETLPLYIRVLTKYKVKNNARFYQRHNDAEYENEQPGPVIPILPKLFKHAKHTSFFAEEV